MLSSMTSLHLIFPYVAAKHIYKHTSGRNFAQNAGKMENVDQSGEGGVEGGERSGSPTDGIPVTKLCMQRKAKKPFDSSKHFWRTENGMN